MLADKNKTSVIVPVHNGAATLSACLASLIAQTRPADELIIVDNASRDRTKDIIADFAGRDGKMRYIFEAGPGRGRARNAGLRAASGEIIAMTDADCVVPPDWLERLIRPIETNNEAAVMGFETDGIDNYWSQHRQAADDRYLRSKTKNGYIDFLDTKNFAIRADILKGLEFNPALVACEDLDLFLRLKKRGIAIRFLPELKVRHCHVSSFRKLANTQFRYGRYSRAIAEFYRNDAALRDYLPIPENAHLSVGRRLLSLLLWSIDEIIHHPQDAPYKLTDDWAWKIGALSLRFKPIRLDRQAADGRSRITGR
ncbi:MAG: glycosyltransferase [Patescibacteria group bacterium]